MLDLRRIFVGAQVPKVLGPDTKSKTASRIQMLLALHASLIYPTCDCRAALGMVPWLCDCRAALEGHGNQGHGMCDCRAALERLAVVIRPGTLGGHGNQGHGQQSSVQALLRVMATKGLVSIHPSRHSCGSW